MKKTALTDLDHFCFFFSISLSRALDMHLVGKQLLLKCFGLVDTSYVFGSDLDLSQVI